MSTPRCVFNFVRDSQTFFPSGCSTWHSCQQCRYTPIAMQSSQHTAAGRLFAFNHSSRSVVLFRYSCHCTSSWLMMSNSDSWASWHSFSLFCKISVQVLHSFLMGPLLFVLLNHRSSLYILETSNLSHLGFPNIFFTSMACLLIFLMASFTDVKFI